MNRMRRALAVILLAAVPIAGGACSDDDKDGESEIEVPEVNVNPDNDSNTQP